MKTAIVFLHGNLADVNLVSEYLIQSTLIICADGGVKYALEKGIVPHAVVGDLDSITVHEKNKLMQMKVQFIEYPTDKDFTDSELAIENAIKKGATRLIIAGFLGDRVDHLMANVMFLDEVSKKIQIIIVEKDQKMYFVRDNITLQGKKGDELSLIPLRDKCERVKTKGLQYELQSETLRYGGTRGVSNVFIGNSAEVSLEKGTLMVIHRRMER